jgi:predicted ester cyclase
MFRTFEDWTWESGDLIIDGDRCAQLFASTATHSQEMFGVPATHRRFRVQGVLVFELRDGKITSERRLYDFTSLWCRSGY